MKLLKDKILEVGELKDNRILKVDMFLNHQIDVKFLNEIGKEFKKRFSDVKVDKIITIEASGIAIACIAAQYFDNVPVVFAKKVESQNLSGEVYRSKVYSYTKDREYDVIISKKYIKENENVLLIDDFLANGGASLGLVDIIKQANANVVGIGIVIEKSFQDGVKKLQEKGVRVESLAKISSLDGKVEFKEDKKVLILSASTGNGHNQAANSLRNEYMKNGYVAKVVDIFKKDRASLTKEIFEKGYDLGIKLFPDVYGTLYKATNNNITPAIFKNIFVMSRKYIKEILSEEKPDIIISTHPFSASMVMPILTNMDKKIPFIQVVTDFKAHTMYVDENVDAYIVASEFTKNSLIEKGIDAEKIFVFGIPVREEFRVSNKVESDTFNILMMGGSMGLKDLKKSVEAVLKSELNIKVTVVCGNNEKLKVELEKEFITDIQNGRAVILGYTDKISKIMDESKIIITKPGGLTSTESISKKIPMLIPFYIQGQEEENTQFLVENNMAIEVEDVAELPEIIEILMKDPEFYEAMVTSMNNLSVTYSVDNIIELSKNMIENK